jgi:uncharacterized protein with HEPN domain
MIRSDDVYLKDIAECIRVIFFYSADKSQDDFLNNIMLQDAVIRRFEIIDEASSKVSETFKTQNPNIPWRLMMEMRNKLIHEYFGVSPHTLYQTIKTDLSGLAKELKSLGHCS